MKQQLSTFINLSRWFSALLVVVGHVAHLVVMPASQATNPSILEFAFYLFTGLGHEAVVVFFVISGYLVGGSSLDKWLRSCPDFIDYAAHRFARIYTVLVPALIIGFAFDFTGMHYFNAAQLYTNTAQYHVGSLDDTSVRLTPLTFVGNVLMLEGNFVTTFGSNGPLWSLAYEWWYYCLFGLVAIAMFHNRWRRVFLIISASLISMLLPSKLLIWMGIWLIGTITYFICKSSLPRPRQNAAAILFLGIAALSAARKTFYLDSTSESMFAEFGWDISVALSYCVLLFCSSGAEAKVAHFHAFHQWAAGFSYSMYLFHFPALLFLVATANQIIGLPVVSRFSGSSIFLVILLTFTLYLLGFLFSLYTERFTSSVRQAVHKFLTGLPFIRTNNMANPD